MKTRVILAGGDHFAGKEAIWEGDLPMINPGILFLHTDDEDREYVYRVSDTAIQAKGKDLWQVVYVLGNNDKPGRRMIGG